MTSQQDTVNKYQEPRQIACEMGLVGSSKKDSLPEASVGSKAWRRESVSRVFSGKNNLTSLKQRDYGGTCGNVGIWTLFSV